MTNNIQDFFRDDPWDLIKEPCYPEGRRLYLKDERFWVSMDENREILFFVQDKGADGIKPLEIHGPLLLLGWAYGYPPLRNSTTAAGC